MVVVVVVVVGGGARKELWVMFPLFLRPLSHPINRVVTTLSADVCVCVSRGTEYRIS